ncbi:hypothetical protein JA1_003327 [Spathaspora sp. JA1]|nr:hypothetical protein JA1_003327 [Spathaspora sp. JA1]
MTEEIELSQVVSGSIQQEESSSSSFRNRIRNKVSKSAKKLRLIINRDKELVLTKELLEIKAQALK